MEVSGPTLELFKALSRVRRAWHDVTPTPEISKSLFTTLLAIAHADNKDMPDYVPVNIVDGCIAVSDLALIARQSVPVISQRVKALEDMGYLRRETDPQDRRICRVALTQSGIQRVEKAHNSMKNLMNLTIEDFGAENMELMIEMLNKLTLSLEKAQKESNKHLSDSP